MRRENQLMIRRRSSELVSLTTAAKLVQWGRLVSAVQATDDPRQNDDLYGAGGQACVGVFGKKSNSGRTLSFGG